MGSAVAEVLSQQYPVPLERIGINDCFGISGSAENLLNYFGLTTEAIVGAVKKVIAKKRKIFNYDASLSAINIDKILWEKQPKITSFK